MAKSENLTLCSNCCLLELTKINELIIEYKVYSMEFSAAYVKKVAETVETLRQITNETSEKT